MTAEIAILNKQGVALAADSAVTLTGSTTPKVYNSANKLFMLSKYRPVGVMVYRSTSLMGIPWETVIKDYREELQDDNFDHLREFAEAFLNYLESSTRLFPPSLQLAEIKKSANWFLYGIREELDREVQEKISLAGQATVEEIQEILEKAIASNLEYAKKLTILECFSNYFVEELVGKYGGAFRECATEVFEEHNLDKVFGDIETLCALLICSDVFGLSQGGLVIAGFGRADIFPAIECYTLDSVINKKLKKRRDQELCHDVNESQIATIVPFAQREMVARFIRGIDPAYKQELNAFMRSILTEEYPKQLLDKFGDRLNEQERRDTQAELIKLGRSLVEEANSGWAEWEQKKFISPVLEIVSALPKDELAEMAESLVNLTSVKRRISAEAETVGGPIDVAVISKGDGFVWIKRKHYFKAELNPGFLANYYRRGNK